MAAKNTRQRIFLTQRRGERRETQRGFDLIFSANPCVLCISGSYGQLLDYIIFAVLVFYVLTILGLFVLRRTHAEAERPYKAIGYPILPAIYIVMALFIDVVLLRYKPQYTWPGLFIVLLGIPVYYIWRPRNARA